MIIHFFFYYTRSTLTLTENFGAASAPMWFDESVVHRGSINCAFFRPNLVERLVPLADQYQLVVSVLCAQNTSYDQRRVARSVHFSLNAIPAYGRGS